jgi:hypothetical protein
MSQSLSAIHKRPWSVTVPFVKNIWATKLFGSSMQALVPDKFYVFLDARTVGPASMVRNAMHSSGEQSAAERGAFA